MAEKWELITVFTAFTDYFNYYRPGKPRTKINQKEFVRARGGVDPVDVIPFLLDDGWEPFNANGGQFNFKRKVNS